MEGGARSSDAAEPAAQPARSPLARARTLVFETDESALSPPRRWLIVSVRFVWLVVRALVRDRLQIRAASLSFSTLLALVPALALVFAIAKATGLLAALRDDTLMPFIDETLGADPTSDSPGVALLRSSVLGVIALVDGTSIAGLGVTGSAVLVLAIWRVLRGVDEAFQHVFEHRGPRRVGAQRLRAWVIVAVVTPLGLSYAVTTASLSHGPPAVLLDAWIPVHWARDLLLFVLPPVVVITTLLVLYLELPDTQVRFRSALFGAVAAGLAWYGLQIAHVRFQVGLASWNAIYSGFGAFPVLLASVQISWLIVLVGAQLVALHQHSPTLRVLVVGARRDYATLAALGLEVTLALVPRDTPIEPRALAQRVKTDLATLRVVLDSLEARGIVSSMLTPRGKRYLLAVEPSALRTNDILAAIGDGPEPQLPWRDVSPTVQRALELHRRALDTSEHNHTLAELAGVTPGVSNSPKSQGS